MARVSHISECGQTTFLEFRDGRTATVDNPDFHSKVGDIVLIDPEEDSITEAPSELWKEETWVGITKLVAGERVVIEIGGRLRLFPVPQNMPIRAGLTVEGTDSGGILGIISEKAIKFLDDGTDDALPERFIVPSNENLSFDDFGGYGEIVTRARELIELPLRHHDALRAIGTRPIKGILFSGPSGTGKTLLARIIANHAAATFYVISGPEVLSKWYGQSEEIIRRIFEDAKRRDRAIIFFDEIDSLASQRSDESHEASRRVVGQLLALMDGFSPDNNVMVLGTTNRPQDVDSALRRPGRFDWHVDFPIPNREDREKILATSARKLRLQGDMPHRWIAEKTESWTPAELAAIWTEAALLAVSEGRDSLRDEDYVGGFERVAKQRRNTKG
ncbi:ATP-binding protein [Streptomyces sp. MMS21 TC-5]|uniref:ATP-binding protein n=1 Tax=unclassified Streptomyces TaxID=2593676 RepID=UPI001F603CE2|nr:ATP-binding protein [Streptomyces sp. MMS21 TC-5]MCI4084351.1 AAA family ATPase [Streptomyces sp. MMS21 TC-5]